MVVLDSVNGGSDTVEGQERLPAHGLPADNALLQGPLFGECSTSQFKATFLNIQQKGHTAV